MTTPTPTPTHRPLLDVTLSTFADDFSREGDGGPDWTQTGTHAWQIEEGRLCGQSAKNHGIWLNRTLPVNARFEFDAVSYSPEGDLKAEFWGDGRSNANADATSYLTIFGGWQNKVHALARLNEHGADRKAIDVDDTSDDPRQRRVNVGQVYRFKVERSDGRTVRWSVDGLELFSFVDPAPLSGTGHDRFGFNGWRAKVCFDNVRIVAL